MNTTRKFLVRPLVTLVGALAAGLLAGCGNDTLPDYTKLGGLRVLALVANTPEVAPGSGGVTLQPYISDLSGNGRTLTYTAERCTDPGVGFGATPSCEGVADRVVLATNAAIPLGAEGAGDYAATYYTGRAPSFTTGAISAAFLTVLGLSTQGQFNGWNLLVTYKVTAADGEVVQSYKRILVSTRGTPNTNPAAPTLSNGSSTLTSLPGSVATLYATGIASSAESFQVYDSQNNLNTSVETLTTTWFYSEGEFQYFRTVSEAGNVYTPPTVGPTGRGILSVLVTRDSRGGESVTRIAP